MEAARSSENGDVLSHYYTASHLTLKMEATRSSETLVSYHIAIRRHTSPWRWRQDSPPKRWYLTRHYTASNLSRP